MALDYYRVLNVSRAASAKEIKAAYLKLAKTLHPDVTGNDAHKAERFKDVSEAHAVLSDARRRREYDAARPLEGFGPRSTAGETRHPYARGGGEPDLRARPMYGINEEVWLAHHYGPEALRRAARAPPRYYGMNVAEERAEREEERIRQRQKHYKLHSTAGYFLRREARLKRQAEEEAAKEEKERREQGLPPKEQEGGDGCVVS